jgi:aryl-alcohol dehydrogenase-like predicted oxidoreductase
MNIERIELEKGYSISRLIKGGWHLTGGHGDVDPAQALVAMATFVEHGITTFDCADHYTGVEDLIGNFRIAYPELAKTVQIHTKIVPDYGRLATVNRPYLESIIDRSLKRMRVEQLDLVEGKDDHRMPCNELT